MSHIGQYACSLGAVNLDVLKRALAFIAAKQGGRVTNSIKDYDGNTLTEWEGKPIIAALSLPSLNYGIGITQNDDGTLNFVGDPYRCEDAFSKAKSDIEFAYRQMAAIIAVNAQLNMELKEQEEIDDDMVVIRMEV